MIYLEYSYSLSECERPSISHLRHMANAWKIFVLSITLEIQ